MIIFYLITILFISLSVLPPNDVIVELLPNNMVNIKWQPSTIRPTDLYVMYSARYSNSSVQHNTQTVSSAAKQAVIGPLHANSWYNVTIQALPVYGNDSHIVVPSKTYVLIVENNNLGK